MRGWKNRGLKSKNGLCAMALAAGVHATPGLEIGSLDAAGGKIRKLSELRELLCRFLGGAPAAGLRRRGAAGLREWAALRVSLV